MNTKSQQDLLRQIPAVDQLLLRPAIASLAANISHELVVFEIQRLLQGIRDSIRGGADIEITPDKLETALAENLHNRLRPKQRTVINATGVVLHTNLGRAPLSASAQRTLSAFSVNYTNLEYDLNTGERSHRDKHLESLLHEVLGCEAAVAVNNNAAAVFLILNTLAAGKEVIVSRGELVEIGGSFRIPDIMARSGAHLIEIGTTNKTRIEDYQSAIGPNTAMLLRVHPSNYRMHGFTEKPALREMVDLAKKSNIPLVEDIGSGCLLDLRRYGIADEPLAQESLFAGVDVVCFSGDKLLGGPQAGIIAGLRKLIDLIRRNPLMRTYRVEKLIYGALEATLNSYRCGKAALEIPVVQMIAMTADQIKARARRFLRKLRAGLPPGIKVRLLAGNSLVGGGSCPECQLPTTLVALQSDAPSPNALETQLRSNEPPIILRVEDNEALIDLRTVFVSQEPELIEGLIKSVKLLSREP